MYIRAYVFVFMRVHENDIKSIHRANPKLSGTASVHKPHIFDRRRYIRRRNSRRRRCSRPGGTKWLAVAVREVVEMEWVAAGNGVCELMDLCVGRVALRPRWRFFG